MLKIKNLKAKIRGKEILKGINLNVPKGKTYILFGPNGSGKTSLLMAILGFPKYKITGKIIFKNKDISKLSIDKRARLGIALSFQRPPTIKGLKLNELVEIYSGAKKKEIEKLAEKIKAKNILQRGVNENFSGGEIKKAEILQVLAQDPDLLLIDEPESGVDVENIDVLGRALKEFLKSKEKSALIITHSGAILKYIKADKGFVMVDGKITCQGDAKTIFKTIQKLGYKKCVVCHKRYPNNL
jgi:Fe-S cluster assembly ATP-binding protein